MWFAMLILTHFDETYRPQGQTMLKSLFRHASERARVRVLWLGDTPALSGDGNIRVIEPHQLLNWPGLREEKRIDRTAIGAGPASPQSSMMP